MNYRDTLHEIRHGRMPREEAKGGNDGGATLKFTFAGTDEEQRRSLKKFLKGKRDGERAARAVSFNDSDSNDLVYAMRSLSEAAHHLNNAIQALCDMEARR